jgi:hypothetical protein
MTLCRSYGDRRRSNGGLFNLYSVYKNSFTLTFYWKSRIFT